MEQANDRKDQSMMCHYHSQNELKFFCVRKQCTLPLCTECVLIHKREHISKKVIPTQGIISIQQAKQEALKAYKKRREEITTIHTKFDRRVIELRNKFIKQVDENIQRMRAKALVTDGGVEILCSINDRINGINEGSIKQLIAHYEDINGPMHFRKLYKLYTGDVLGTIALQIDEQTIKECVIKSFKMQTISSENVISRNIIGQIITQNEIGEQKSNRDSNFPGIGGKGYEFSFLEDVTKTQSIPNNTNNQIIDQRISQIPSQPNLASNLINRYTTTPSVQFMPPIYSSDAFAISPLKDQKTTEVGQSNYSIFSPAKDTSKKVDEHWSNAIVTKPNMLLRKQASQPQILPNGAILPSFNTYTEPVKYYEFPQKVVGRPKLNVRMIESIQKDLPRKLDESNLDNHLGNKEVNSTPRKLALI